VTLAEVPPERGRIALFGDVGGQAKPFRQALIALGADADTLRLPADLTRIRG